MIDQDYILELNLQPYSNLPKVRFFELGKFGEPVDEAAWQRWIDGGAVIGMDFALSKKEEKKMEYNWRVLYFYGDNKCVNIRCMWFEVKSTNKVDWLGAGKNYSGKMLIAHDTDKGAMEVKIDLAKVQEIVRMKLHPK